MLKKTITYTDFNGNQRTEDHYFNLTKAEITEMELRENLTGGLEAKMRAVAASNDGAFIMDAFKELIAKSYGVKSLDGRSFLKTPEISAGFLGSEAYSVIFMELISNPQGAAAFVNAIVPHDIANHGREQARPQPQDHLPAQTVTRNVPSTPGFEQVQGPVYPTFEQAPQQKEQQPYAGQEQQLYTGQEQQPYAGQEQQQYIQRPPHESGSQA